MLSLSMRKAALYFLGAIAVAALPTGIGAQQRSSPQLLASLRPHQELRWQRVSPSAERPDGPVLYQLVFNASGTPGTVPAFDTNPRHLTNSPIAVSGGNVVIGGGNGLNINGATGIISFAAGQTFPGTGNGSVTSVATGAGLTGGPITTTGTISIANGGVTTAMIATAAVTDVNVATGISYSKLSGAPTSLPPNGSAGGSLTGTYPNPTIANGAVTTALIADGAVTTTQMGDGSVTAAKINSGASTNGQVLTANGSGGVGFLNLPAVQAWGFTGNAGTGCTTTPCTDFIGTVDNTSLEGRVNNHRAMRIEPATDGSVFNLGFAPNVIGGASGNRVTGVGTAGATIAGGGAEPANNGNVVSASFGTVAGGEHNTAGGLGATVGGGAVNNATNSMAVVAGGNVNTASGTNATVCGGQQNVASGGYATIGGGLTNAANNGSATVSGGSQNTASGYVSTIAGGNSNQASGQFAFVGGGQNNTAGKNYASIGGGFGNSATGIKATIAGGGRTNDSDANTGNRVSDDFGTVGGGGNNQAGDNAGANPYATVAGGQQNTASGIASAVGGGNINTASGNSAVVTGGSGNLASGFEAGIAGGFSNTASGQYSFVAGGQNNIASGDNSFAAGKNAKADQNGAMIFAAGNVSPWVAFGTNIFEVFASSGATFDFAEPPGTSFVSFHVFAGQLISTSSGAFLTNAGVWTNASDRNLKTNFEAIDPKDVLDKVAAMSIQQWKYKVERDGKKHIGPMAQDFYAAFGLGDDDKHIGTVDESGVAFAAIQGLNQKLEDELREKDVRLSAQQRQIELLQQQMQAMMTRVKAVEVNQNRAPRQARLVVASH